MKNRNILEDDNWATPKDLYNKLDEEFNFDFDPCPYNEGTIVEDGLLLEWGNRNFVNPPYSRKLKEAFVKKAVIESQKGKLCVLLLPVSTSTKLYHKTILPNITEDVRFLEGRVKFEKIVNGERIVKGSGQFDSMIVIFDGRK